MQSILKNAPGRRGRKAGTSHQEKRTTPSKNRVWDFFGVTWSRTGVFRSETQCLRRENPPTATTTASGVRYYGYRYYYATLGRWITRDPIGENGGMNVYGFVENAPIDIADWLGNCIVHLHLGLSKEELAESSKKYPGGSGGTPYGFFVGALKQYSTYEIKWNIKCGLLWRKLKYNIISPFTSCEGHIYIRSDAPSITLAHELRHFDHYKTWYKKYTALHEKYEDDCMCPPCYDATKELLNIQADIYKIELKIKDLDNDITDYKKVGHKKSKLVALKGFRDDLKSLLPNLKSQAKSLQATRDAECE